MTPFVSDASCIAMSDRSGVLGDELLVSAARSGDRSAFVALCEGHAAKILGKIYQITQNWQDAEDVLQESFLKAFIHLKDFEGRSSFSSWLTKISINTALMLLRKKRFSAIPIDQLYEDRATWHKWEPRDRKEDPESGCVRRERKELLRRAILRLPPIFREVIELRHAQDYSTREVAQLLGISEAAAKSRLLRAKTVLRASIMLKVIRRSEDD
jgi:RNA polymerase sigma-70 factor (ECF subfamily)